MVFNRFSLRGFKAPFELHRRVEGFGELYICTATLYKGKHFRRQVDELSVSISTLLGEQRANSLTLKLRRLLLERNGLFDAAKIEPALAPQ